MSDIDRLAREYFPASTPRAPLSGLAVASLTLGVLATGPALLAALLGPGGLLTALLYVGVVGVPALLAIIFGHVALSMVRAAERRGRGIAMWGAALGYLALVGPLAYNFLLTLLGLR